MAAGNTRSPQRACCLSKHADLNSPRPRLDSQLSLRGATWHFAIGPPGCGCAGSNENQKHDCGTAEYVSSKTRASLPAFATFQEWGRAVPPNDLH